MVLSVFFFVFFPGKVLKKPKGDDFSENVRVLAIVIVLAGFSNI